MNTYSKGLWLAVAVGGLLVSGCATESYVDEHIATVQAHIDAVNGRVDETNAKVDSLANQLGGRLSAADQAAQSAQARADAAYKLAQGKFVMAEVSTEQVYFDTGKWDLNDKAKETLTALADKLKSDNVNVYLDIRGHADVRGGSQMNRNLGRERAAAVFRFLSSQGVPGNKMILGSWGEEQPASESNAENRRVVIAVMQ